MSIMSSDAFKLMSQIAEMYISAERPNHKTWVISLSGTINDPDIVELQKRGLIQPMAMGREPRFFLTDAGHDWVSYPG